MVEKIKRLLSKVLPKKVFNFLILAWRKTYIALRDKKKAKKLASFKEPMFKTIKYKNIKFDLKIDPRNGFIDNQILLHGIYEKDTFNIMYNNVKKGDICIDVGANIGLFTNFLPYLVGDNGYVYGFEPIKSVYEQNLSSLKKNNIKNVKLYNYACSDIKSETQIHVNYENIGASSIIDSNAKEGSHIEKIKTMVLDEILGNEKKIDFMKIDTEGFELNVLKGALGIIKRHHPKIFMEFSPCLYSREGESKEILELIKTFYNKIYVVETKKLLDLSKSDNIKNFFELQKTEQINMLIY